MKDWQFYVVNNELDPTKFSLGFTWTENGEKEGVAVSDIPKELIPNIIKTLNKLKETKEVYYFDLHPEA